jgi:glycosyltransferase involved in cell wall biosynthesis
VIASSGVKVTLIIEKCSTPPVIAEENLRIVCLKFKNPLIKSIELSALLIKYNLLGFKRTFVRISLNSAIIAIIINKFFFSKTYYWQSGTISKKYIDFYGNSKKGMKKSDQVKFFVIKTFTDYFVTGPESMVHHYVNEYNVKHNKIKVLYNDIDLNWKTCVSDEARKVIKSNLGFKNEEIIILIVHRISPMREMYRYIPELFDDISLINMNLRVLIVGEGPDKGILEKKIEQHFMKGNIEFIGSVSNNELSKYYEIADIFVNPSYNEGFPRVLLEAMLYGLPILSTDAGGSKDLFSTLQKSYIVDRDDPVLMREKLLELVGNESLRTELSSLNLIDVRKYSTQNIAKMYINTIFYEN